MRSTERLGPKFHLIDAEININQLEKGTYARGQISHYLSKPTFEIILVIKIIRYSFVS